jgi:hypothetical protein
MTFRGPIVGPKHLGHRGIHEQPRFERTVPAAIAARATATDMRRTVKHYKRIQSILGDHQDTVVARAALRRMATGAGTTAGENGFTVGLPYAREEELCRRARSGPTPCCDRQWLRSLAINLALVSPE